MTTRMRAATNVPALAPQGTVDRESLLGHVLAYEGAVEGLARIAGVMGRWCDGAETLLVLDLIRALCADADRGGSGNVYWLGLRLA